MSDRIQQRYKSLRLWEFITCAICFGLASSTFVKYVPLSEFVKAVLFIPSASYLFLTTIDIIMISASKSLPWMPWLPLSICASLLYFVCTGFLIFAKPYMQNVIYEIIIIAYLLGGILFLLDVVLIIHARFLIQEETQNTLTNRKSGSLHSLNEVEHLNKAVQVQIEIDHDINAKQPEVGYIPIRDHVSIKKPFPVVVSTHGGTFHVSKSVVPFSTAPKQALETKRQEPLETCECEPIKVRTIAIGVKPIAKQTEDSPNRPKTPTYTNAVQPIKSKIKYSMHSEDEESEEKSKGNDYIVYHCTTNTGSEQSTRTSTPNISTLKCQEPLFVDPPLLSPLEDAISIVQRSRNDTNCKIEHRIHLQTTDDEPLEFYNYKTKLYNFIYPVKPINWNPRSHFDLEAESTLQTPRRSTTVYDNVVSSTTLPGTVDSTEPHVMVNIRKNTIMNEAVSYAKRNVYAGVSESKTPENSSPHMTHSSDDKNKKKNCPFM